MITTGSRSLVVRRRRRARRAASSRWTRSRSSSGERLRAAAGRTGHPRLRRGQRLRHREPPLLHGLGARQLGGRAPARAPRAREADGDRGRDRLRDRASPRRSSPTATGCVDRPFTVFSAVVYTIPSLALFQLLVPVTGLTVTTVEIALVGYTLLILFRNILEGLRGVPPDVLEAARGMGYTRGQTLWRIELPLAVPAMMAGLRVAVVSTIALATVAALVIPEGLGYPIFLALREAFKTEIIVAGGARGRARARRRRAARAARSGADAVGARAEDGVIRRVDLGVFADAVEFVVDERDADPREDLGARRSCPAPRSAIALLLALPLGSLARAPPPRLVRRHQPRERRPGAPEPRRDRDRPRFPRDRLHERHGRARRPRRAADPHERVRRRRRRRARRGRGGARDGDDPLADRPAGRAAARAAADLRRASAPPPSSSSRRPRSPPSRAAAGSATSSSTRPATASRASSARRSAFRCSRSPPTPCSGSSSGCSRHRDYGRRRMRWSPMSATGVTRR